MEDNFRNVLIILSAVVITAIFIHGLWTIRKQKNPYKLKTSKNKIEPVERSFDQKGFDQDGVGQVKVSKLDKSPDDDSTIETSMSVNPSDFDENHEQTSSIKVNSDLDLSKSQTIERTDLFNQASSEEIVRETVVLTENKDTQDELQKELLTTNSSAPHSSVIQVSNSPSISDLDDSIESDWFKEATNEKREENESTSFTKDELGDTLATHTAPVKQSFEQEPSQQATNQQVPSEKEKRVTSKPLYEQPVTQAKPTRTTNKVPKKKRPSMADLKRDQMEIDFDNQAPNAPVKAKPAQVDNHPPKSEKVEVEPQVIIISVVMPENQQMIGAVLLPSLLTLGLKYGEMNIFHRHEDNAGNGKVTFSLANIMNPGSFDLDSMENFATRGVSLFMTLPNAGDSFAVFDQMLSAAKQLATEFNGQVLDDKRNILTKQTEQHYLSKIREFERKSSIGLVE